MGEQFSIWPKRGAPCEYEVWSDHIGQHVYTNPAVSCHPGEECFHCGWNPAVAERRLRRMGFRKDDAEKGRP